MKRNYKEEMEGVHDNTSAFMHRNIKTKLKLKLLN